MGKSEAPLYLVPTETFMFTKLSRNRNLYYIEPKERKNIYLCHQVSRRGVSCKYGCEHRHTA